MDDLIRVNIRTGTTGHDTVALPLEDLPAFIDRKRIEGQLTVASSGSASVIVRIGRDVLEFFRGRRRQAAEEGREREKEEVTVLNPLAGGSDASSEGVDGDLLSAVLSATATTRMDQGRRETAAIPGPHYLERFAGAVGVSKPLDAVAEMRAWRGLVAQEGDATVAPLLHGGGVAVRSQLWPNVLYLVQTSRILVLREGQCVHALCLQVTDGAPIWDAVADRLQLLRVGPDGEAEVWATSGVS